MNIERNAEDAHMRDIDEAGHYRHAEAGKHADTDGKRRHAQFAGAQTRTHRRQDDQRRAW